LPLTTRFYSKPDFFYRQDQTIVVIDEDARTQWKEIDGHVDDALSAIGNSCKYRGLNPLAQFRQLCVVKLITDRLIAFYVKPSLIELDNNPVLGSVITVNPA
jgi:hypothetical protein